MRIGYISDQQLPRTATDTAQMLCMVSALGRAGAEMELVLPASWVKPVATAEQLSLHYQVEPAFAARGLRSVYPAVRGVEKLAHALRSALDRGLTSCDVLYTRNLPVVCAVLSCSDQTIIYETYRPWPRQARSKRWLFRWLVAQPRLLGLVLHSQLAATSYREVGFGDDRMLVAYNGFDPGLLRAPLSREQARQACGLAGDRFTVTYAGRVSPKKGLSLLLAMAQALPELDFVMVGSEGNGPVERRAAELPNVTVVGWCKPSEMVPYLYAADALLIPPTGGPLERIGNTVLPIKTFLYLAVGRPIFAAATPDLLEVLEDGRNAVLVAPDDLNAAIRRLRELSESPEQARRIGDAARSDAANFTWDGRARRVLDFVSARLDAAG
jgi:glycosyltransferase involved in cell wall biosynthesis